MSLYDEFTWVPHFQETIKSYLGTGAYDIDRYEGWYIILKNDKRFFEKIQPFILSP